MCLRDLKVFFVKIQIKDTAIVAFPKNFNVTFLLQTIEILYVQF